jgi:nicotinate-nucleotide adenylyltransferase
MIHPTRSNGAVFKGLKIGLLGGSFNPAHEGHLAMSLYALKRLGLDQIWWLVSPQNPLKSRREMAPLARRLSEARALLKGQKRILATGIEAELGARYTYQTLAALRRRMPEARFVWLMGSDNLRQIPRWARWATLFETVPIAVFRRFGYVCGRGIGKAATRFASAWQPLASASKLGSQKPPAWLALDNRRNLLSGTFLRRRGFLKRRKED